MYLSFNRVNLDAQIVALDTPESDVSLTYRGKSYQLRQRLSMPSLPIIKLKYRGVDYFQSPGFYK